MHSSVGGEKQHIIDEDIIETGVNSHITNIIDSKLSTSAARKESLFYFLNRAEPKTMSLTAVVPEDRHKSTYRNISAYVDIAVEFISDLVSRVCNATEDQLPYRHPKPMRGKVDPWHAPALTNNTVNEGKDIIVQSRHIGAPGYSLFVRTEKNDHLAPDVTPSICSTPDCASKTTLAMAAKLGVELKSEFSEVQQLICGHRMCGMCQPNAAFHHRCRLCVGEIERRTREHAVHIKNTLTRTVLDVADIDKTSGDGDGGDGDDDDEPIHVADEFDAAESAQSLLEEDYDSDNNEPLPRATKAMESLRALASAPKLQPPVYNPADAETGTHSAKNKNPSQYACEHPGCGKTYVNKKSYLKHLQGHEQSRSEEGGASGPSAKRKRTD